MGVYKDFIIFIIGVLVIIKSADLFTSGAEGIAKALRIPRIIIGLTIVSFVTTTPEFTVSVIASSMKLGGMAVGNAVGSCLANIGLILAITAIVRTIKFDPIVIKKELLFLIGIVLVLYLLMLDSSLSFLDGLFLLFLVIAFFTYITLRELKKRKINEYSKGKEQEQRISADFNVRKDVIHFLLGMLGVILSSKYAVIPSGINIAHFLKVPEIVIGLSMVAVGTSLPELFTALVSSFKGMGELAAGNVIGANILNILWVIGSSSLINPLSIDMQTQKITMPVVFILTVLTFLFAKTNLRLTRKEGIVLLIIYAGYVFYLFKFAYI